MSRKLTAEQSTHATRVKFARHGVRVARFAYNRDLKAAVGALRKDGLTYRDIAGHLGVSYQRVGQIARAAGRGGAP